MAMEHKPVICSGTLLRPGVLSFGAFKAILKDATGEVVVWVEPNRWPKFDSAAKAMLTTNAKLKIRGTLKTFFDKRLNTRILELIPDEQPGCIVRHGTN